MRRLFSYILKHNFGFLFLLLEILAFFLVIQNNYQRASIVNSSNKFTGSILKSYHNVSEYFTLNRANELLVQENILLRKQLESSFRITDTSTFFRKDSLFSFIGAKVISNSINNQKNYIMLDKGESHGIQKDMGVITSEGIVGTVVEVSSNYSRVMSVLHIQNKVNARIKKNRHLGNIEWNGRDYRRGTLSDIPTHVALYKGDTIITSGNSNIFPEGIYVGTVDEYRNKSNEKFNTASVNFMVDYNQLYHVYVIVNLMQEELSEIREEE